MRKTLQLKGLDCAACAAELENLLVGVDGVQSASVVFMTQKLVLEYVDDAALQRAIDVVSHFEEVEVEGETASERMKRVIRIENLDCAACALELQEEIGKIDGVYSVSVDFVTQKIAVEVADAAVLQKVIDAANHFEEVRVLEEEKAPTGSHMTRVIKIENLDCAACALELQDEIGKLEGVYAVSVDFVMQRITVEVGNAADLRTVIETANHFEEVRVVEEEPAASANPAMKVIKIENLHCAACAMELQEELEKIEGVREVSVDFVTQTISVDAENDSVLKKVVKTANHFEKVRVVETEGAGPKKESHAKEILQIVIAAAIFLAGILVQYLWVERLDDAGIVPNVVMYAVYLAAYFIVGYPVLISTCKNIAKGHVFDENFLMTLASVGAFIIGEAFEGVAVMLLYQIGELLQSIAVGSSRRSITELMGLRSESATLIQDGVQITVKPEELKIGDVILVKAGEKIPVDAVVTEGETALDTKSLTGEALPRNVKAGDEVLSGCINSGANIYLRVVREYTDSAVAKILDMVENSASKKAEPEKFITKFAKYYTPIVCLLAVCLAIFPPLIICIVNGAFTWATWADWISRALTLLVISCPCAIVISVPLTYFGGIGCAARYGILVKGSTHLDTAAQISVAAFDKTGTLTEGNFRIVNVGGKEETLLYAAAAEHESSHPLAKPFEDVQTPYKATDVEETAGRGVRCLVDGKRLAVGNAKLLAESGVVFKETDSVSTVVYVAADGEYLGYIEIDDSPKQEAAEALGALKAAGVKKCFMITGDTEARAQKVADEIGGIDGVCAGLLPDEKLKTVESLKSDGKVLYVGDGINDAPVMSVADCSFSMGKIGSGAAIEASDFVLVSDRLTAIPTAIRISKKTRSIVLQNLVFSIAVKVILMIFGVIGILPLVLAVFGDVGVMLLAVLNSIRMRLPLREPKKS